MDFVSVSYDASSRRHGVSRWQIQDVVRSAAIALHIPAHLPTRPDDALLFLGADRLGSALEVVGVMSADRRLRVIHAMPLRQSYRSIYEEVIAWHERRRPS